MEVEGEEGTDAAAAGGGATRGIDATGATLSGEASEATTERPKDFSRWINCVALIPSNVVLFDTGVLAFWAYDTVG